MLNVKKVSCGYGLKEIIKDLSFTLEDGEIFGVIGPNGCGKTTLLRAITRVVDLNNGKIELEKRDIKKMDRKEIAKKIAVVSQSVEKADMTVEELVVMGRYPYFNRLQLFESAKDHELAEKYMQMTDVLGLKDESINEISGGELQLALIARALIQETKLILLDEPISHLDIAHQIKILDLIRMLNKKEKRTFMIVLHDLNLASEYCDRLAMINEGKLDSIGTPADVITYENIERIYKTVVVVKPNPISLKPYVVLVPGESNKKQNN